MTQGSKKSHQIRLGYFLGNMVNKKRDIGLFVALFEFLHKTINYLNFSGKWEDQPIKNHNLSCLTNLYDLHCVWKAHSNT